MKKIALLFCLLSPGLLAQGPKAERDSGESFLLTYKKEYLAQELGFPLNNEANILLYDTITNWIGTPYKYAGNCTEGVDCSGFVTVLFNRVYGKNIGARSSEAMYHQLTPINKEEIKEGDLVFFKTNRRRISHVGLYLGNNRFVHSSTSKGVIISDLDELYYKSRYAGAGRWERDIANSDEKDK